MGLFADRPSKSQRKFEKQIAKFNAMLYTNEKMNYMII